MDYYIGLEVSQEIDNSYSVNVKALDLAERTWVTGFNKSWHGQISMLQRQALRERKTDETFLGARDVPFATSQNDLLARHLAHELSCALMRQTNGDYIVPNNSVDEDVESTLELVSNNIAANDAIELTSDASSANAELLGKAHHIDGALFPVLADDHATGSAIGADDTERQRVCPATGSYVRGFRRKR